MKVIKDDEHCLLLNYFGIGSRYYLAITVMTYFDYSDPHNPLKEQELWPFVQGELGKDAILDMAMPKPMGEYLVWGKCFPPDNKPRIASRVKVRVGQSEKTLYVYGDRHWKEMAGLKTAITDPEPFVEMPITYEMAFGGEGFAKNPVGKGAVPVILPSGISIHPLPNIEDPSKLVGSPGDNPEPAGFGPLHYTWPQRARKLGTYDNKWFQENWPFYPDDMNWTYFNAAPEDQQRDDFWTGNETFQLTGMHAKKPVIESRLPGIRHRFFVNQLVDPHVPDGETDFKEVISHIDTLWFFPHAEKGIVIHRGSVEIKDDEALDVPHLYVVSEHPGQDAVSAEKYYEQFKKSIDRSIMPDIAPQMEDAKREIQDLADSLKDLPLQINDAIDRGLGKAPKTAKTPTQVALDTLGRIEEHKQMLTDGEKQMLELKKNFGHLVKIDMSSFAKARQSLDEAKSKIAAMPGIIQRVNKESGEHLQKLKDTFDKTVAKRDFSKIGDVHIDHPSLVAPGDIEAGNPWHMSGMLLLEHCRDLLMRDPDVMTGFRKLGLRPYTIERSWLGITREDIRFDRKKWGLKPSQDDRGVPNSLVIPAGLLIPCFEGPDLKAISVRSIFESGSTSVRSLNGGSAPAIGDFMVDGSNDQSLALGCGKGKPFIRVRDPLEAIFLNQELVGFCAVVAMKDSSSKTCKDVTAYLKEAPQLLVVHPDDEKPEIESWKKVCTGAEFLPLPKGAADIFEAKNTGLDIWQWVYDALHPGLKPDPAIKPKEIDISEPGAVASLIPAINVKDVIKKVQDNIKAQIQPKLDMMESKDKEIEEILAKKLEKKGLNPNDILKKPFSDPLPDNTNPYTLAKDMYAARFTRIRQTAQSKGLLSPVLDKKLTEVESTAQNILSESAKMYDEGMARIAALDEKLTAGQPEWAKKLLVNAGFDPDDPAPLRLLTREEVIERHKKGLSLAGKNMAGTDLSGLDLRGANMKSANLQKTIFKGSFLDGADLSGSISNEADFSGSSLKDTVLTDGMFLKAKFPGADLSRANLTGSMMSETDLTSANLTGATLERTLLEKAILKNARAHDSNASQIYLLSADMTNSDFSGADLTRAVFLKTNIEGVIFMRSVLREAAFLETHGDGVNFSNADMHNSRILGASAITNGIFENVEADRASWMKSDLSGGNFRGARIERGLLQECNLSGSDLSGINAKLSRITKSDLSDSNCREINLFQGSLRKSKLVRTDLTRANLYGAEFYRTGVGETKLNEANLKMTKLYKRTDLIPEPPKKTKKDSGE